MKPELIDLNPAVEAKSDKDEARNKLSLEASAEPNHSAERVHPRGEKASASETDSPARKQKRVEVLQNVLMKTLDQTVATDEKGKPVAASVDAISNLKTRLKEEQKTDDRPATFDHATRTAYKKYIDWLESNGMPSLVQELHKRGIVEKLPPALQWKDINNAPITGKDSKTLAEASAQSCTLGIDSTKEPGPKDIIKLAETINWLQSASSKIVRFDQEVELKESIQKNGLPATWLERGEMDKDSWYERSSAMVNLTQAVGTRIDALHRMQKAGADLKFDLPPGTNLQFENEKGKLQKITLDLPTSLNLDNESDIKKYNDLLNWLKTTGAEIDKLAKDQAVLNSWGDHRVSGKVELDQDGNVIDMTADASKSFSIENYNLIEERFNVHTNEEGKIVVESSLQFQRSHWLNYMDMWPTNIGKPITTTKEYDPDAYVRVPDRNGDKLIRARDLESWKNSERRWHYGPKILTGAMDIGFTAMGGVGISAACRGLVGRRALGWSVFHGSVGATGFITNSAATRESGFLSALSTGRHAYFIASAAGHLIGGAACFAGAKGAEGIRAITAAEEIEHALRPSLLSAAGSGMRYRINLLPPQPTALYKTWTAAEKSGTATTLAFTPILVNDLAKGASEQWDPSKRINLKIIKPSPTISKLTQQNSIQQRGIR